MITSKELNRVLAALRKVNRAAAGKRAEAYAEALLPDAARHRSVADVAALAMASLALYCAAASCTIEAYGVRTVQRILDRWYALLLEGSSAEHVFARNVTCAEGLERNRLALMRLPTPVLAAGVSMVREAIRALPAQ
ncbi:MAG TPA: hypothetical protein VIO32_10530 [Candidatus Baltobacteraceae bacterium]